ncbi:MAG: NADH-quinone oxidoreductase subunit NuoB [Terriglobales bacterium]
MILDVVKRSLASPKVLIPVEQLLTDASGGRMPDVDAARLTAAIAQRVVEACPTSALSLNGSHLALNYGECIGCGNCVDAGQGAFFVAERFTRCGVSKSALVRRWDLETASEIIGDEPVMAEAARMIRAIVGRALNIREVDGGSCNGCEAEIVALNNPYYDLERFAIHFVASPKHADMLLVTGPVTRNMAEAVRQTYEATPSPKLVVAVGACGCTGGIFAGSDAVVGGVDAVIPVDGYIPGCPPTPAMLLTGILRILRPRA